MATVFMKWLETSPRDYDRGVQILTLGRLGQLKEYVARWYVRQGTRVLEIGCGTGTLTTLMAAHGAQVTAIDISPPMLNETLRKVTTANLGDRVTVQHMDATLIGDRFPPASFDLIVATLVFSELSPNEQRHVLKACVRLLAPGGRLLVADEVIPGHGPTRLLYYLVRLPLTVLTWLLTRTTTHPLRNFEQLLADTDLHSRVVCSYLGGSLVLYEVMPATTVENATSRNNPSDTTAHPPSLAAQATVAVQAPTTALPPFVVNRLQHRVTPRTLLVDLWALFFRIIPPYPKVRPGLYAVGAPGPDAPVLVTGNFDLTVRRLVKALDGKVHAWLLVADSSGINVWCAAGGGFLTADRVIAAVRSSRLDEVVTHRALILPQLCATGVDGWKIRRELGWGVHWGPVRATDIPAYLEAGRKKSDDMRWVRFPLKDRLEMTTVTLGFYSLLILLPVLIFWRHLFWPIALSLAGLSYFYGVVHPWLPGHDGLTKSVPLALIALVGMGVYSTLWDPVPLPRLFNRALGMIALSVFTGGELQGMSPLMRGEQANWGWEALVGALLGATYWLAPLVMGWR